jgi:hypothetical protein
LLTNRAILPTIILAQTLICIAALWLLGRRTRVTSPGPAVT